MSMNEQKLQSQPLQVKTHNHGIAGKWIISGDRFLNKLRTRERRIRSKSGPRRLQRREEQRQTTPPIALLLAPSASLLSLGQLPGGLLAATSVRGAELVPHPERGALLRTPLS
jgi:hypothetical protein